MGSDQTAQPLVSFDGVSYQNPPLDELTFDLIDRGMNPPDAISWMHRHGYPTIGLWYPDVQVIGFAFQYMAFINGEWDIVRRIGA